MAHKAENVYYLAEKMFTIMPINHVVYKRIICSLSCGIALLADVLWRHGMKHKHGKSIVLEVKLEGAISWSSGPG